MEMTRNTGPQAIRAHRNMATDARIPLLIPDWPFWAKALKLRAKPEDKGIGDVLKRTIGNENSEAFKKWFKLTFNKDCGCTGRQAQWNMIYPLK